MYFLYVLIFLFPRANCLKSAETDLILTFLKANNVKHCFFLVCWTDIDKVRMSKIIIEKITDLRFSFLGVNNESISKIDAYSYSSISYVLDFSCEEVFPVLEECSTSFKFTIWNSWLMFTNSSTSLEDVKNLFSKLDLRMDMDVQIAVPKNNNSHYDIYEIYDPGRAVAYKLNLLGTFTDGKFSFSVADKNFFQSRRNMSGVFIRNGNVNNFTEELLWKYRNIVNYNEHGGVFGLYLYYLFQLLVELTRFNYNTTIDYPWFGPSDNGTDGGLGKLLYEDKIDMQCGGGLITIGRTDYFEVLMIPYMRLKSFFFYRSPGIKKPGAQVMKPLAPEVWYFTLLTLILTGIALGTVYWIEDRFFNGNRVHNFFSSAITLVGVLTQQGSAVFPQHLGGRVVFLNSLIFSIWIYNYYTSGLVSSLLNSKPQMLTSYRDLYESPLAVGMENEAYIHRYIKNSEDPYLKLLYERKVLGRRGAPDSIFSAQEGLEKIRKGGFAFNTMLYTAYPIISTTFDQEAICDLGEILLLDNAGAMFVRKRSQYKDLFAIGVNKLWENGLSKQVYDSLGIRKPECRANLLLAAVGPQELFLVYLILLAGFLLSFLILLAEVLCNKIQKRRRG